MKLAVASLMAAAFIAAGPAHGASAKTLDIYFIDVEGGQSTLIVTPAGESLLVDTGFPSEGLSLPRTGEARDASRIMAAARDAGVQRIDYLLITHFHGDHAGGVPALAQLLPVATFIDHGVPAEAEKNAPGMAATFNAYIAVRSKGRHIEPKPGERLPLRGIEATVVSSAAVTLAGPLGAAGAKNAACPAARPEDDKSENAHSTGIVVQFGKFRFLDLGDLTGRPLFDLVCPSDLVGPVDVYLVAHHGGADSAQPATFAAFKPRVAIMNNGLKKGGARATYELLHTVQGMEDVWQLHSSASAGEMNFAPAQIANLDESTAYWIKLSANEDGSFSVANGRTGAIKNYNAR